MSASTHEAVLGGARWRLTLHPDGRWEVAKRVALIWDEKVSGNDGLKGVMDSTDVLRAFGDWCADAGADVLDALATLAMLDVGGVADVAERSTT